MSGPRQNASGRPLQKYGFKHDMPKCKHNRIEVADSLLLHATLVKQQWSGTLHSLILKPVIFGTMLKPVPTLSFKRLFAQQIPGVMLDGRL
jgi:hypothetical protein